MTADEVQKLQNMQSEMMSYLNAYSYQIGRIKLEVSSWIKTNSMN